MIVGEFGISGDVQMMRVEPLGIMPFSSMRWILPLVSLVQCVATTSNVPLSSAMMLCS